jgi:signal peptidase II
MNIIIFFCVLILDFFSKFIIVDHMHMGDSIYVLPFFNIVYAKNLGVSFSFLSNKHSFGPWLLAFISFILVITLVAYARKITNKNQKRSIMLIISGALANIIDRFLYGGVIDFLDFYYNRWHWPAFNIADTAIVLGVVLYIFFDQKK